MKPISQYISAMLATLFGVALISCSSHSDAPDDTSKMSISFRVETRNGDQVNAGEGATSSGNGYEEATQWENYIDIDHSDYRIAFFDNDNRCITPFTPTSMTAEDGKGYVEYTLEGKVPGILTLYSDFKIVVLANWGTGNYPEIKSATELDEICCPPNDDTKKGQFQAFTGADFIAGSATKYVPMYGVKEYSGVHFGIDNENNPTVLYEGGNFGPVYMLRAVAKVEVIFDTTDKIDLKAENPISITRINEYGYCAPEGVYTESDYFHDYIWDMDFWQGHLHLVNGQNDAKEKSLVMTRLEKESATESDSEEDSEEAAKANENLKNYVWVAYIPEYRNLALTGTETDCKNSNSSVSEINKARIAVSHTQGGKTKTSYIDFATYADGEPTNPINIERNNLYRFTITNVDQGVKWKVEALPWNGYEHEVIVMKPQKRQ